MSPLSHAQARVQGTVQGVGFRPYVYRLASELCLNGFVLNDSHGVLLEVEGGAAAVERFFQRLEDEAPPLARIERVITQSLPPAGDTGFRILRSLSDRAADTPLAPDTATCEACLRELLDPRDRRHRYPFINCTDCGPRFTIIRGVPYDRPLTTMAGFDMCERCTAEYQDPADRRFHAQPNACSACGPSVSLLGAEGSPLPLDGALDAVQAAAEALRGGAILAIKGLGGFHLACRADDESAVAKLRARKHREQKPFALMVRSLEHAERIASLRARERSLLESPQRPIVLLRRRDGAAVASAVAPSLRELGLMLPYTPLHHLILADLDAARNAPPAIVMTSGNLSEEPIAYRDEDARSRLCEIADALLVHDRPIQTRTEDSVIRVIQLPQGVRAMTLRRARGYVPESLSVPIGSKRPLLACGAQLKSTFCLVRGRRAWVSHHVGDLGGYQALMAYQEGIEHFQRILSIAPELIAHDLHPDYASTKHALQRDGIASIAVQHHHAHLAACLAEHGESAPAIGAIYDGSGYGLDGTIWGGEILYGDLSGFQRVGMLRQVALPGGERAIAQPWRMACAWLAEGQCASSEPPQALRQLVQARRWRQLRQVIASGLNCPLTSSVGRLFDAVAAICGVRGEVCYEGQAAIELEAACDPHERRAYPFHVQEGEILTLDPRPTIEAVAADAAGGVAVGLIASRFHAALVDATVKACVHAAAARDTDLVVLSGGVFANARLLEPTAAGLHAAGLRVITPLRLPCGDGGISYGQAAVGAASQLASA
jgi:hydrogenase maturation protein HypF